jgi:hypothetical protein
MSISTAIPPDAREDVELTGDVTGRLLNVYVSSAVNG